MWSLYIIPLQVITLFYVLCILLFISFMGRFNSDDCFIFFSHPAFRTNVFFMKTIKTDYTISTYCVRKVNAADVMEDGSRKPLMISCHSFLLITSTRPPRAITRLYSSYRSSTDFAIIGSRFIGVPGTMRRLSAQKGLDCDVSDKWILVMSKFLSSFVFILLWFLLSCLCSFKWTHWVFGYQ